MNCPNDGMLMSELDNKRVSKYEKQEDRNYCELCGYEQ